MDHDRDIEQAAFRRLADGEPGVREQLVERYLPLVRHLAGRYAHTSEPFEDLVQVGSIGLLNAIDRFDVDAGTAFSSFAVPTILGEMRRHFRDRTWSIHVPRPLKELAANSRDAEARLERKLGRAPTARELAETMDVSVEDLIGARLAAAAQHPDSLDRAPSGDEDSPALQDRLGQADPALLEIEGGATLEALTEDLDDRGRELLRLRFEEDLTQREIGERVGLSQMHVSRLIHQALKQVGETLEEAV